MNTSFRELVPILQLSIGPVILISGVGLLLLTLTNRFGRMVDRARLLNRELAASPPSADPAALRGQVDILQTRAGILRTSIILATVSVLLVAILILTLFLTALLKAEGGLILCVIFAASLLSLIGSMVAFIQDMNLSLAAVRLEIPARK